MNRVKQRRFFIRRKKDVSLGEEIANSVTHGLGVILGIVALVLMVVASNTGMELMSSLFFSISMINLYLMSTLYHAFKSGKVKRLFKRFDHLSIYILIAGTYAPFLLVLLFEKNNQLLGLILFCVQWGLVAIGVTLKSVWIERFGKLHLTLFLLMGWACIIFVQAVIKHDVNLFGLLLAGGICYTVGAVFYATRAFKYSHMVWHIFVFAGSICHFLGVYLFLLLK